MNLAFNLERVFNFDAHGIMGFELAKDRDGEDARDRGTTPMKTEKKSVNQIVQEDNRLKDIDMLIS